MKPVQLIHHAAHRGLRFPPSSLSGLRNCLDAGGRIIEIDVVPLADGDFALAHDGLLEHFSDGHGPVAAATADQITRLRHRWRGGISAEPVGLLSQAVALARQYPALAELQLDLKPHAPLTDQVLAALRDRVAVLGDRVRVSSPADWALRRLHALAPQLALGFDPLLYLDLETGGQRDPGVPPQRCGAYGYWDDHPLAGRVWGSAADYLAARADALWMQMPWAGVWYLRAALLARSLDDGFDWIAWLHARGAEVAAWTLDADRPHHLELARRLAAAGVDRITTNDPERMAAALGGRAVWGG